MHWGHRVLYKYRACCCSGCGCCQVVASNINQAPTMVFRIPHIIHLLDVIDTKGEETGMDETCKVQE